ncbi:hypothetical protein H257_04838 [Aphanomyces astaci]|uniref:CBM1 domain-containing protein n=1 Tax=Aphanomyces astaci TaxID=112090 RepID=W4GUY8_APHAT|nr:hypothetical protein H257_04838 [Aphanomyces astaci]ETV83111.1 hypothetical protein H257_04838 [Aphanomyces astaci]|eukprot:XP_009827782.1 hypothetical protein H257_04838 [Aphanomyces astaci]
MRTFLLVLNAVASHVAQGGGSTGCAHDFSQCGGVKWPYLPCCASEAFECSYVNDELSLCLQTPVRSNHTSSDGTDGGSRQRRQLRSGDIMSSAAGASGDPAPYLGQCGGLGYSGSTICTHGLFCHVESPYYSSCLFNPTDDTHVAVWRKCGGANWSGQTRCQEGSTCQVQTMWYSQCVPL